MKTRSGEEREAEVTRASPDSTSAWGRRRRGRGRGRRRRGRRGEREVEEEEEEALSESFLRGLRSIFFSDHPYLR